MSAAGAIIKKFLGFDEMSGSAVCVNKNFQKVVEILQSSNKGSSKDVPSPQGRKKYENKVKQNV